MLAVRYFLRRLSGLLNQLHLMTITDLIRLKL